MPAHSSALRQGRYSEPGRVYLITTVTFGRRPVFADFNLARLAIGELRTCDTAGRCQTVAFVLMPEHLHWLVTLTHGTLPKLVGHFKANAARVINRQLGTSGQALWQSGFHDHALRHEEHLRTAGRYIVNNPVRAGLARSVGDYPHWDAIWV